MFSIVFDSHVSSLLLQAAQSKPSHLAQVKIFLLGKEAQTTHSADQS